MTNQSNQTSLEAIQDEVYKLFDEANSTKNMTLGAQTVKFDKSVEKLVELRSKLINAYGPVINLIEWIELKVKELEPEPGSYGVMHKLTIQEAQSQTVDEVKAYKTLMNEHGHIKALSCFKIKLTEPLVKVLLKDHPSLTQKGPVSRRYVYSKK